MASIKKLYPSARRFELGSSKKLPLNDHLWILPLGDMHSPFIQWLKFNCPNPYKRPRMIFFLNGEGAKLCYHLVTLKDFFRVDDEWVVSSEREKRLIDAFIPNNNRTHVLYYPVAESFRPGLSNREKLRKKFDLPPKSPVLLYAGRISQQKNVIELLDVLEKFPRLFLAVCGEVDSLGLPHFDLRPDSNLAAFLTNEIARRKLSTRIRFYGQLSQEDLKDIMKASDFQISLSTHYGEEFGYSIAQGLSSGLRSILTDWGGHGNWRDFFSPKEIAYVRTTWSEKEGTPVLDDLKTLPTSSKKNFTKAYRDQFRKTFKAIIQNRSFSDRKVSLEIRDDLLTFWSRSSETLFQHPQDPLFQEVIRIYRGD